MYFEKTFNIFQIEYKSKNKNQLGRSFPQAARAVPWDFPLAWPSGNPQRSPFSPQKTPSIPLFTRPGP